MKGTFLRIVFLLIFLIIMGHSSVAYSGTMSVIRSTGGAAINIDRSTFIVTENGIRLFSGETGDVINLTNCTIINPRDPLGITVFSNRAKANVLHSTLFLFENKLLSDDSTVTIQGSFVYGGNLNAAQWSSITSNGWNMFSSLDGVVGAHSEDIAIGAKSLHTMFLLSDGSPRLETTAFNSPRVRAPMLQLGSILRDNAWGSTSLSIDQRGANRPDDINTPSYRDVGSVEVQRRDLPRITDIHIVGYSATAIEIGNSLQVTVNVDCDPNYGYNFNELISLDSYPKDIVRFENLGIDGAENTFNITGVSSGDTDVTVSIRDFSETRTMKVKVVSRLNKLVRFRLNGVDSDIGSNGKGRTEYTIRRGSSPQTMFIDCEASDNADHQYNYDWKVLDASVLSIDTTAARGSVRLIPISLGTTEVGVTVSYQGVSITASCDVKITASTIPVGIMFEEEDPKFLSGDGFPIYRVNINQSENKLLKIVYIEKEITPQDTTMNAKSAYSNVPVFELPDEISFDIYVRGENAYIYVRPLKLGVVHFKVTLDRGDGAEKWDPAECYISVEEWNPAAAATALAASDLFEGLNKQNLNDDNSAKGTRILQGPDLFESMLRNRTTLKPISVSETNFFSIFEKLPVGCDPMSNAYPLNWFAVQKASFANVEARESSTPLYIRIPGGRTASEVDIKAPLGYPACQKYIPLQAIFIVPRGVYGVGAHDRTLANPSLLLTEYCKILVQLPENLEKSVVDLFGGEVSNLTVEEAIRTGTLEFFMDTATKELIAVLNYLLIDGKVSEGMEGPVTFEGGLLRISDGIMNGEFKQRMWLAEKKDRIAYKNAPEINVPGGQNQESDKEKSSGGGCNAAGYSFLTTVLIGIMPFVLRKR